MKIDVAVTGVTQTIGALENLRKGIKDFRGATWTRVRNAFFKVEKEIFASEGGSSAGGKWKALSSPYKELKQRRYGDKPILQASGRFYRSLTSRSAGAVMEETPEELTLGSSVEYGGYHRTGTSRMARRDPTDFTQAQRDEMTEPIKLRIRQLLDNLKLSGLKNG